MSHRRSAALVGTLLCLVLAATACGSDDSSDVATSPTGVPSTAEVTTTAPSSSTATTVATDTTAVAPRPTSPPATPPPATSPPATDPPVTAAPGRTAALGENFALGVGETVTIPSEGLSVTFGNTGPDNRCRPGLQCIIAGNASIGVPVAKAGAAGAVLALNTNDSPMSASYGPYTVELVRLSFGSPPIATLRVT